MDSNSNFTDLKYRKDIQVFRGLAVFAVVLYHLNEKLFPLGYLGVDAFFVISGFVMTPLIMSINLVQENHMGRRIFSNLIYFYKKRFFRLAPALATTLIFSAIIVFIAGPISDHQAFARQGIATVLLIGNLSAFRYSGDYFFPNPNPLIHTWSLSVEEQIYIVLPLVLILVHYKKKKSIKKTTKLLLTFITLTSFILFIFPEIFQNVYNYFGIASAKEFSFYLPTTRIWQFALGGLGFLFLHHHLMSRIKLSKKINLVFMILCTLILFGSINVDKTIGSILASSISVIVLIFKSLDSLPKLLCTIFEWLGDRSYSIYLVHVPLIYIMDYSPISPFGNVNNYFKFIVFFTLIIFLGSLQFSQIENRFRRSLNTGKASIFMILFLTTIVPIVFFSSIDRIASNDRSSDQNLPVGSKVTPWAWDKNCQFLSNPDSNVNEPCVYGNSKTGKSLLLIGDSHAATISRSVIKLAKNNDMKTFVFTFQGCGFILNDKYLDPDYSAPYLTQSCLDHNKAIVDFVRLKNPTLIILAHRSSSIMVEPNDSASRSKYNGDLFKSLLKLKKIENNIIVVGSVPEYIDQNSWIQKVFGVKRSIYSNIPFDDNVFWNKSALNNFYYLDTIKIFCTHNVCSNKSSKGWLFQDRDHLSELGGDLLIPELDRFVKNILSEEE